MLPKTMGLRCAPLAVFLLGLLSQIAAAQQGGGSGVTVRRIIGLSYPRLANLARVQGRVELVAKVTVGGAVEGVRVVSGHPLLVDSAKGALLGWRFSCPDPSKPCEVKVTFAFQLLDAVCEAECCPSELEVDLPQSVTVRAKQMPASID